MPITILFCYAREDEALLNKLKTYLRSLQRQGLIDVWYDRDIRAGTAWEQEIKQHLSSAQIALMSNSDVDIVAIPTETIPLSSSPEQLLRKDLSQSSSSLSYQRSLSKTGAGESPNRLSASSPLADLALPLVPPSLPFPCLQWPGRRMARASLQGVVKAQCRYGH